mgnify:CR=1 FL=1
MSPFVLWLSRLSAFASMPAVWGIFFAGAVIYLIAGWRVRLLALIVQFFFIGILYAHLFADRPEIALLKLIVGWLVCGALYLSARMREEAIPQERRFSWAADVPFRALTLAVLGFSAYIASQRYILPFVSADLAVACFLLGALALLFIGTEEDTVVVGVGILNLLAALDLFYSSQDPGLLVTGFLVVVNLLVGLAISYLTVIEVAE